MAPKDQLFNHEHNDQIRSDYRPNPYRITDVDLYINLDDTDTVVRNRMVVEGNPKSEVQGGPLILQGEDMDLNSVKIKENGEWRDLDRSEFVVDDKQLIILRPPQGQFELEVVNEIDPSANTALQGIYKTGDIIGSQNESMGFRHITYYLDRPDNLAKFTTTLEADKEKYPILISNGNGDLHNTEDLGHGRHKITWVDPWPKPSYLFATIAGDMKVVEDTFTTMEGKDVALRIVVPPGYEDKVDWAMHSIKRAMKWDEEKYGNVFDLDNLHLIGLEKFNMGAMENKGAIVFNIKDLCGSPDVSTDTQLLRIETVVAHEYYHNYTGDRVTVRDWFEISLKESLTEYRNEQFASDMNSRAIETIDNASYMRTVQFREDAGPTAHCVRPERVEAFENIYSPTVYQKGAQILRMMNTLMGDDTWYHGVKHYLNKYDGQAVNVDDFIDTMQEYSGKDLSQFRKWYYQAGTPEVSYEGKYDADKHTYTLTLKQHVPATPGQPAESKVPMHIPVKMGLISESGKDIPLTLAGETGAGDTTRLLDFTQAEQTFVFTNVNGPVVPSLFRDFSAPVKVMTKPSNDELLFRIANDSDSFNRYDAVDVIMTKAMTEMYNEYVSGKPLTMKPEVVSTYGTILSTALEGDMALASRMLSNPAFSRDMKGFDPEAVSAVQEFVRTTLAKTFRSELLDVYEATKAPAGEKYEVNPEQMGRRDLHNYALGRLASLKDDAEVQSLAKTQYAEATNMTDKLGALSALVGMGEEVSKDALASFREAYKNNTNVMDTWLTTSASGAEVVDQVKNLMSGQPFDLENPNKVRALVAGFAGNAELFHNKDGSGYKLLADIVIALNGVNDHTASGIVGSLAQFGRYDAAHQKPMIEQLQRIAASDAGPQVKDVVGKALAQVATGKKPKGPKLAA